MSLIQLASVVFWVCLACVLYAYVGYPIVLGCLARLVGRRGQPPAGDDSSLPSVTVLIAAYNEEAEIDKRIQTALMTDYPADKLDVVIASDGSSDGTAAIVRGYAGHGVRLLDYRQRRGKATVLNDAFAEVQGDVVLLSDANTHIDPTALRKLVRWFDDPEVGVVVGRLVLTDPATGRNVDGLYWKYETYLKRREARLGGLLGANGAIYAIRRRLFAPIPNDTIVDDFVLPLQAQLRTGCRLVYEAAAVAQEETPLGLGAEFHRRSRIGAGGFQSLTLLWPLLHPRHGWTAFTFLSHKVLRWLCPFFLIGLLASNTCLLDEPLYQAALLAQAGFYLVSLLAAFVPARFRLLRPLRLTTMFTSMNAALLVGFCRWLFGSQKAAWKRTARLAEVAGAAR
jgi:cellulose synthase/poly-beta-1,6-N-acetylglucosamine synthase-like glycosyltransferase